jgi:hypothetical protein
MTEMKWVVIAAGLSMVAGCSSRPPEAGAPQYLLLQEVNDLLHAAAGATGRPPARLADLNRYQTMFPRGYAAVKSGQVEIVWGAVLKGEGAVGKDEAVVAYEKSVPSDGGYVLLSAGTVRKMTAAEFAAVPKGAKK